MQRRSLFDSISLAFRDFGQYSKELLIVGAAYALMNFIMHLPLLVMDVEVIFDGFFQGHFRTYAEMSREQQMVTLVQTGVLVVSHTVNAILWVGGLQLALTLVDGGEIDLWDAVCTLERVPIALGWALYGILIFPFFMCCLLPGFAFKGALLFWPVVAIDKDCGGGDALRPTLDVFRHNLLGITGVYSLVLFLDIVGASCFQIGSVVTFPMTLLIAARAYRLMVPKMMEE